ncbi:MAG: sulfotransferase [Cycloclasticus sp.]|nr:sulfotransferase [Cycloclasticus sp.]
MTNASTLKVNNKELSIIIICFDMQREIKRTICSLLPPYQEGIDEDKIEIMVIDNGSKQRPSLGCYENRVKFIQFHSQNPSPVMAINHGISIASADLVGVFIDGARMATPGLLKSVITLSGNSPRVVISTLAYHLGPDVQMNTVFKGYDQTVEDKILEELDWEENGYDLYLASSLALSSKNGLLGSIAESNAIFMSKELWSELSGYEELFITPGGGLSNLDLYKRVGELASTTLIRLANEATFHQVHGGVATNTRQGKNGELFKREYENIRGKCFVPCDKVPYIYGKLIPQVRYFFAENKSQDEFNTFNIKQNKINQILAKETDGLEFKHKNQEIEKTLSNLIDSPIILIGRGGSGTRLLSQLLQEVDLFLGNTLNISNDSEEWIDSIYDLVINEKAIKNKTFGNIEIEILRLNALKILTKKGMDKINLWGFKLPEIMLCVPELKMAFPKARFIHITRHPITISFRRTHMTSRLDNPIGQLVLKQAYNNLKMNFDDVTNTPDEINNVISWVYQVKQVLDYVNKISDKDYLHIRYEDICQNYKSSLDQLYKYLDLTKKNANNCPIKIDQSRFNNFNVNNAHFEHVWSLCEDLAKVLNYHKYKYV